MGMLIKAEVSFIKLLETLDTTAQQAAQPAGSAVTLRQPEYSQSAGDEQHNSVCCSQCPLNSYGVPDCVVGAAVL